MGSPVHKPCIPKRPDPFSKALGISSNHDHNQDPNVQHPSQVSQLSIDRNQPHLALSTSIQQHPQCRPVVPVKPASLRLSAISPSRTNTTPSDPSPRTIYDISSIDQAHEIVGDLLDFSSIRVKFQSIEQPVKVPLTRQKASLSEPNPRMSRRTVAKTETSRRSVPDIHPPNAKLPPPVPAKRWGTRKTPDEESPRAISWTSSVSPVTVPRTGSFVAELSRRLEQAERMAEPVRQIKPASPHPTKLKFPNESHLAIPPPSTNTHRSTSLSTLRLPLPRSATGTSVNSMTSTSSNSSGTSRRAWPYGSAMASWLSGSSSSDDLQLSIPSGHVTNSSSRRSLFPNMILTASPPSYPSDPSDLPPVSPDLLDGPELTALPTKRARVVQEILETERTYATDMRLVKEIYYDKAFESHSPLNPLDVRHIFSNLLDILALESDFLPLLENACKNELDSDLQPTRIKTNENSIGKLFREMTSRLVQVYGDYCKRHEDALNRLQELEAKPAVYVFLSACKEDIQGRTMCWDLPSLLIKPVQRVLKYPLLLKELVNMTPTTHPDYEQLTIANKEIQGVADAINEIKRRKDIVEKIVREKKRNEMSMVHGFNKTLTRHAQRFRQTTGLSSEPTQDQSFDALYQKFESQQEIVRQWVKAIQEWGDHLKHTADTFHVFLLHLESFYNAWGGVRVKSMERVQEITRITHTLHMAISHEVDALVQGKMCGRVEAFLKVYESPGQVIHKRARKLLDYDRVRYMKNKGDIPDKVTQESADAYVSINAQLVDELPRFFLLTARYFGILVDEFATIQARLMTHTTHQWRAHAEKYFQLGDPQKMSYEAITQNYHKIMTEIVQPQIDDIQSIRYSPTVSRNLRQSTESVPASSRLSQSLYQDSQWLSEGQITPQPERAQNFQQKDKRISRDSQDSAVYVRAINRQSSLSSFLIEGSDPVFECVATSSLKSQGPEALSITKGDIIQVWLPTKDQISGDTATAEWWYGSLRTVEGEPMFGWVPSWYCQKI
ncbi:hypothetical protein F4703DRAFT_1790823 [Phycomyces blakesleeanus]